MPRGYIMTLFPWLYGLVQHHLHLGEWGWSTQFCSDRPKTSDLDVSDQVLSIPALPQARISGAKCLFYFLDFRSDFATIPYPLPPFRLCGSAANDRPPSTATKKCLWAKENHRLNLVPWGAGDRPWWVFHVIFFFSFHGQLSAQQEFPDKRFLTKVPPLFFIQKKP